MKTDSNINFVTLWKSNINHNGQNLNLIPLEYQLIVTSNGSLTQNLNCITTKNINILLVKQKTIEHYHKDNKNNILREVWLQDEENNKLVFAQSFWKKCIQICQSLQKTQGIGKLLIESEIDIYKEMKEISYGYLFDLELMFETQKLIWSRQYISWHKQEELTIVKEFFFFHA